MSDLYFSVAGFTLRVNNPRRLSLLLVSAFLAGALASQVAAVEKLRVERHNLFKALLTHVEAMQPSPDASAALGALGYPGTVCYHRQRDLARFYHTCLNVTAAGVEPLWLHSGPLHFVDTACHDHFTVVSSFSNLLKDCANTLDTGM